MNSGAWEGLLADLVRRDGRLFLTVAYRILRDPQSAEDACQTAFAKALEHRESIESPRHLKAWLATVVVNESLQQLRRRKREGGRLDSGDSTAQLKIVASPAADETAITEDREAVWAGIERLSQRNREVIILRLIEGMSGQDAAVVLECSKSEISRRLHEGMEQLRQLLK